MRRAVKAVLTAVTIGAGMVPAAAVTNAFAASAATAPAGDGWRARYNNSGTRTDDHFAVDAICAKQPAGYTTTFTTVDNPAGAKAAAVAVCPAGTRLLSGGTLSTGDTVDVELLSAWPLGPERFKSVMWNGSAADQQLTTFAICGHRPAGYTITSATGSDTGGPVTQVGGAQCPAGTSILGGGIHVTSPRPTVTLGASLEDP